MLACRVDKTGQGRPRFLAFTPTTGWFHNVWCYANATLSL
jgi:hypothetical protein